MRNASSTPSEAGPSDGRPALPVRNLRPDFGLIPDLPAREAVRIMVRTILAIARQQEEGILTDLDPEFL
ncbi:MAG: hypothetical protein AAF492_30095, partial [Verrucomicrobiota bacterium]